MALARSLLVAVALAGPRRSAQGFSRTFVRSSPRRNYIVSSVRTFSWVARVQDPPSTNIARCSRQYASGHSSAVFVSPLSRGTSFRADCFTTSAISKELKIEFPISIDESTDVDSNVEAAVEQLQLDGLSAIKLAIQNLEDLEGYATVELSLLLCNDGFIRDLNKKWLGKDSPTDVLSFPQNQPPGLTPILLLGDVVISLDTAAQQAEERGHSLLDELRILLVHGLLHVLGYDHELGEDASKEMEDEETRVLSTLGWKGKGLIHASIYDDDMGATFASNGSAVQEGALLAARSDHFDADTGTRGAGRMTPAITRPTFRILFCDMDGTLLNSKSQVTKSNAEALRAAMAAGVQIIIATGKTRPAVITALNSVGLSGEGGIVSLSSPGVFNQGLQVYGNAGSVLHSALLQADICSAAFKFALDNNIPLIGFSGDHCVTLAHHPLVDFLHDFYLEPKAKVLSSMEHLMANFPLQKLLFMDTATRVAQQLRPHWSLEVEGRARVVQSQEDMLEILPLGQSKGAGVRVLLEQLGVPSEEVMAIGDGENDIEMLELSGWGVAMANAHPKTMAVAKATVSSQDEDGVAEAIHRFILT